LRWKANHLHLYDREIRLIHDKPAHTRGDTFVYLPKFEPPFLTGTKIHGEENKHSIKLAQAKVGEVALELIQPLEGESAYKKFLGGIHPHLTSPFEGEEFCVEILVIYYNLEG
jgi:hypothetical protein